MGILKLHAWIRNSEMLKLEDKHMQKLMFEKNNENMQTKY